MSSCHIRPFAAPDTVYREPLATNQIRVLALQQGEGDDLLVCQLHIVDIADKRISYEAISYVWGSQDTRDIISCRVVTDSGQVEVPIARNAAAALQAAREPRTERLVWIDSICISQTSPVEKSVQVAMMDRIFTNAKAVLIWLGPDDDTRPAAAYELFERMANWSGHQTANVSQGPQGLEHSPHLTDVLCYSYNEVEVLLRIFDGEWFWRLWCVQELVLARTASVHFGPIRVAWEVFSAVAAHVQARENVQIAQLGLGGIYNVTMLASFRLRKQIKEEPGERLSFARLLSLTRLHGVTENRDRIFSLLGLDRCLCNHSDDSATNQQTLLVTPDYSQSLEDLYFTLVKALSMREGNLHFLSFVQHRSEIGAGLAPSWVPQWHINQHRLITQFGLVSIHPVNNALEDLWKRKPRSFDITNDGALRVEGLLLATVSTKCSDAVFTREDGDEWIRALRHWFQSALWWYARYGTESLRNLSLKQMQDVTFRIFYRILFGGQLRVRDITAKLRLELEAFRRLIYSEDVETTNACPTTRALVTQMCRSRSLFFTVQGQLGIGPQCVQPGDTICSFSSAAVPFLMRPRRLAPGRWLLVGETYVNGLVNISSDYDTVEDFKALHVVAEDGYTQTILSTPRNLPYATEWGGTPHGSSFFHMPQQLNPLSHDIDIEKKRRRYEEASAYSSILGKPHDFSCGERTIFLID